MERETKNGNHKNGGGGKCFQMPLHYPRYKKKDYESMKEWQLDRLLAEYGLPTAIHCTDLESKREFAMGAFLWPDEFHNEDPITEVVISTPKCRGFSGGGDGAAAASSHENTKLSKIVEILYKLIKGFA